MAVIGPHLLGRIPSPHDARDWKLAPFLKTDGSLRDAAVAELKQTRYGYTRWAPDAPPAGSHWAKAMALLAQIPPVAPPDPSTDVIWINAEPVLDQGDFGTCVGNGFAQWGNTLPIDDKFVEKDARAIYYEATILDGAPDDPDATAGGQQGATVRSGAKAMLNRKRLSAYAFATTVDEIRAYLRGHGPVVLGTNWLYDMFYPDANGYIRPTGSLEGGHCFIAVADLPSEGAIEFINSWSSGWGLGGHFKMKVADVVTLFAQQGEAVCALELPLA